ncbi:MAG TPA: TonB-dependent receptor plug domain-containing protein, partial [Pirellulales bacterium]|nr:TonB-dependent receptor plug domain-containing protein [Pirellulales bacterium]
MALTLRACALAGLVGCWLNSAIAQESADLRAVDTAVVQAAEPPPRVQDPTPELPEVNVVAETAGSGSQGNALPGNTIVETPTRTDTAIGEVGSSISVITGEQIAQRNITNVVDALRTLPGLNVVQNGGPGRQAAVFIRGADSSQTKVLLDGIWMNDPSTPDRSFDFSSVSIDNIDRIEVIRGPQSSLYGSDAMGGVINIFTTRGKGPRKTRVGMLGGSLGTQREWGNITGGGEL